jgi:hypothetical protein
MSNLRESLLQYNTDFTRFDQLEDEKAGRLPGFLQSQMEMQQDNRL